MSLYNHPYSPVLLGLTNMIEDNDMLDALEGEGTPREDIFDLIPNLERCCDCSFRDSTTHNFPRP